MTGIAGDNEYLNNDNYYKDPSEVAGNAPNFPENPSSGALKDPWDDVDIDDDDDYTRSLNENQIDRGSNNKNLKGSADDSDVEDWYDDRFQQQTSNENVIGKKRAAVKKTISSFRMGFSSLKSMLKQKTSQIKENGLYGDRRTQMKEGRQDYGRDQNDQMEISKDKYARYDEQNRGYGNIDPSRNSNNYVGGDYGSSSSSSSDGNSNNIDGGRRNENFGKDQNNFKTQFPERDGVAPRTDDIHSGSLSSSSFSDGDRRGDKQGQTLLPVDVYDGKNSKSKVERDSRMSMQKKNMINRGDPGKDIGDGEHGKSRKDSQNGDIKKSYSFDRDDQGYSTIQKEASVKKISVRSMGKLDETLWADYVDPEEKIVKTVTQEFFSDDNPSRRNFIFMKNLRAISVLNLVKGIQNLFSVFFRLLSYSVPLTNRLALSLLFVALSAAPISTIVFLFLSFLRDLLLPMGILYVTWSVRPAVEAMKVSSLLFSGKDSSTIIISPAGTADALKEDSLGIFQSDSFVDTYQIDVSDIDNLNNVVEEGTSIIIGDAAGVDPTSGSIITVGTGTRTIVDTGHIPTIDTTATSTTSASSDDGTETVGSSSRLFNEPDFIKNTNNEEKTIPPMRMADFTEKKESFKKEPQNFNTLNSNLNFGHSTIPKEIPESENFHSNSHYQEIFQNNFQMFTSATSSFQNFLRQNFANVRNLNDKICLMPGMCLFLGFLFFSLVLCGVILPEIKKNLGEKMIKFLENRVKNNKMNRTKSDNIKNKKISDQINKLEIEESEEYFSDDEEEEFEEEERGFLKKKFLLISRKIMKVFRPRKKILKKFVALDQTENSEFSDELFIESLLNEKSDRRTPDVKNSFSDNTLLNPMNLVTSVISIYSSFYYSLLISFILSLLNIESELKYAMISPYLLFCVLTTLESYVYQPNFKFPTNYSRFKNSGRNNNENCSSNEKHFINDE